MVTRFALPVRKPSNDKISDADYEDKNAKSIQGIAKLDFSCAACGTDWNSTGLGAGSITVYFRNQALCV